MPNEKKTTKAPTAAEIEELYKKLSPENKKLFMAKYYELLMLQELEAGKLEHIKVNLPYSEDAEKQSAGEGVFVLVYPDAKAAYDSNENGSIYYGYIDNDSFYYPELKHGYRVPVKMQGADLRPVVPYVWLYSNFGAAKT